MLLRHVSRKGVVYSSSENRVAKLTSPTRKLHERGDILGNACLSLDERHRSIIALAQEPLHHVLLQGARGIGIAQRLSTR